MMWFFYNAAVLPHKHGFDIVLSRAFAACATTSRQVINGQVGTTHELATV